MKNAARSFALKAEESIQRDSMGFGDIRALFPKAFVVLYRSRRRCRVEKATARLLIENQAVKTLGHGPPYLGIGRRRRERCGIVPISSVIAHMVAYIHKTLRKQNLLSGEECGGVL